MDEAAAAEEGRRLFREIVNSAVASIETDEKDLAAKFDKKRKKKG